MFATRRALPVAGEGFTLPLSSSKQRCRTLCAPTNQQPTHAVALLLNTISSAQNRQQTGLSLHCPLFLEWEPQITIKYFLMLSAPRSPIQILDAGFRLIQRWVFGPVIRVQINRRPSGWGLVSFQPTVNEKIYQGCHGKPTQSLRCFLRKSSLLVFLGPRKVLFAQLESETVCFSYLLHMASLMYI